MACCIIQFHREVQSRLFNLLRIGSGSHTHLHRCEKRHVPGTRCFTSTSAPSTDYLQTLSPVPTMHFQPAIPQLPIPSLQDTCQRYLATQQVFLSPGEFAETKSLVDEFQKGAGLELNNELIELNKKNGHTSYITEAWMNVYLMYRDSVVLNSNPVSFLTNDTRPGFMEQTIRATNFTVSLLRFLKTLRDDKLVPDVVHRNPAATDTEEFWRAVGSLSPHEAYRHAVKNNVHPLDMSQFTRIFNASRIPRPIRDELFKDESERHMLVISNSHMYVFNVLDSNGNIIPGQDIKAHLQYILGHSYSLPSPDHPVGYLTTEHRDTWTQLHEKIVAVCKGNEESLRLIDSALICLCLDDYDASDENKEQLLRRGMYGNAGSRWFDKPFQMIIRKDGQLLINMEHSWGDGVTMKRAMEEAYQDSVNRPAIVPGGTASHVDSSETVTKLDFKLDSTVCQGIEEAKANHALATSRLNVQCMEYRRYGQSSIKKWHVSPDSVAQLALQMAFHRVTGQVAATYESCSTAMFRHGRTETIRSATAETKRCTEAFYGHSGASVEEKRALVRACSGKHRQLTKEATIGQGWDRHLLALRALALTTGRPMPTLFQDPAYASINTITLSTSTTGDSPGSAGAAFAPVSPRGLGIAYFVMEDAVRWIGTSYTTSPSLSEFARSVHEAYDEVYEVMSSGV